VDLKSPPWWDWWFVRLSDNHRLRAIVRACFAPLLACEWKFELRFIRVFEVSESTWLMKYYVHAMQNCWNWKQLGRKWTSFQAMPENSERWSWGDVDCTKTRLPTRLPATGNARSPSVNRRVSRITCCKFQRMGSTTKV